MLTPLRSVDGLCELEGLLLCPALWGPGSSHKGSYLGTDSTACGRERSLLGPAAWHCPGDPAQQFLAGDKLQSGRAPAQAPCILEPWNLCQPSSGPLSPIAAAWSPGCRPSSPRMWSEVERTPRRQPLHPRWRDQTGMQVIQNHSSSQCLYCSCKESGFPTTRLRG